MNNSPESVLKSRGWSKLGVAPGSDMTTYGHPQRKDMIHIGNKRPDEWMHTNDSGLVAAGKHKPSAVKNTKFTNLNTYLGQVMTESKITEAMSTGHSAAVNLIKSRGLVKTSTRTGQPIDRCHWPKPGEKEKIATYTHPDHPGHKIDVAPSGWSHQHTKNGVTLMTSQAHDETPKRLEQHMDAKMTKTRNTYSTNEDKRAMENNENSINELFGLGKKPKTLTLTHALRHDTRATEHRTEKFSQNKGELDSDFHDRLRRHIGATHEEHVGTVGVQPYDKHRHINSTSGLTNRGHSGYGSKPGTAITTHIKDIKEGRMNQASYEASLKKEPPFDTNNGPNTKYTKTGSITKKKGMSLAKSLANKGLDKYRRAKEHLDSAIDANKRFKTNESTELTELSNKMGMKYTLGAIGSVLKNKGNAKKDPTGPAADTMRKRRVGLGLVKNLRARNDGYDNSEHKDRVKLVQRKIRDAMGKPNMKFESVNESKIKQQAITSANLADNIIGADAVKKHKDGTHTIARSFFYKHGSTSEGHAAKISKQLNDLGIKHSVLDHSTHDYIPFKGGASVFSQCRHEVKVKIHPGQKMPVYESLDTEINELSQDTYKSYARKAALGLVDDNPYTNTGKINQPRLNNRDQLGMMQADNYQKSLAPGGSNTGYNPRPPTDQAKTKKTVIKRSIGLGTALKKITEKHETMADWRRAAEKLKAREAAQVQKREQAKAESAKRREDRKAETVQRKQNTKNAYRRLSQEVDSAIADHFPDTDGWDQAHRAARKLQQAGHLSSKIPAGDHLNRAAKLLGSKSYSDHVEKTHAWIHKDMGTVAEDNINEVSSKCVGHKTADNSPETPQERLVRQLKNIKDPFGKKAGRAGLALPRLNGLTVKQ